jgi:hypothetical protein
MRLRTFVAVILLSKVVENAKILKDKKRSMSLLIYKEKHRQTETVSSEFANGSTVSVTGQGWRQTLRVGAETRMISIPALVCLVLFVVKFR